MSWYMGPSEYQSESEYNLFCFLKTTLLLRNYKSNLRETCPAHQTATVLESSRTLSSSPNSLIGQRGFDTPGNQDRHFSRGRGKVGFVDLMQRRYVRWKGLLSSVWIVSVFQNSHQFVSYKFTWVYKYLVSCHALYSHQHQTKKNIIYIYYIYYI